MAIGDLNPYEFVLNDLRAKRARIDAAIAAIEEQCGPVSANGPLPVREADVQSDSFFGLSIADAAVKYLRMAGRKQPTRQIADALERGGLSHSSKDLYNTVYTMLTRNPLVVKPSSGEWGLREWYPNFKPRPKREPDSRLEQVSSSQSNMLPEVGPAGIETDDDFTL